MDNVSAALPPSYWLNQLRAELVAAKTRLCPCGVKPSQCKDHDPRRNPEPETTEEHHV